MPCFSPIAAFELPSGKVQIGFDRGDGRAFRVPCGKCVGCQLERARQWAVRLMHEAQLHEANSFVTLTYDDEHLPAGGSLDRRAFQLFMKRLRKAVKVRVRYYHCGEYGSRYGRPHYHAIIFGFDFPDKVEVGRHGTYPYYRSALLARLWPEGLHEVGVVTYESACYVARYVVGKDTRPVLGVNADGEVSELEREYSTMSRNPGIAAEWFARFGREVYPADGVVVDGKLRKPPRYYDAAAAVGMVVEFEEVRERRRRARRTDLPAAEALLKAKLTLSERRLES